MSECLYYNVNIRRGKRVVYIRNWMDCGIVSLGHLVGPHGYLSYNEFKAKFPNVRTDVLLYDCSQMLSKKNGFGCKRILLLAMHLCGDICTNLVLKIFIHAL